MPVVLVIVVRNTRLVVVVLDLETPDVVVPDPDGKR